MCAVRVQSSGCGCSTAREERGGHVHSLKWAEFGVWVFNCKGGERRAFTQSEVYRVQGVGVLTVRKGRGGHVHSLKWAEFRVWVFNCEACTQSEVYRV